MILAPFVVFSRLLTVSGPEEFAVWGSAALTLNLVVAAMVLKLDANFMEASAAASQRRYEFMRRAQRGGGVPAIGLRSKPRFSLPRFPWLAGAGPVAWRQMLDLARGSSRILFLLPGLFGLVAPALFMSQKHAMPSPALVVMPIFVLGFLIHMVVPLGLRSDLDHVDTLKALPISSGAVVLGSMLPAVMYPSAIQFLLTGLLTALPKREWSSITVATVCFIIPFNLLLSSFDSVLVLLFPSSRRLVPGDFLAGARFMLIYLVKFLFLLATGAAAGFFVFLTALVSGDSEIAMGLIGWLVLAIEGAITIYMASLLLDRFDPSADTTEPE